MEFKPAAAFGPASGVPARISSQYARGAPPVCPVDGFLADPSRPQAGFARCFAAGVSGRSKRRTGPALPARGHAPSALPAIAAGFERQSDGRAAVCAPAAMRNPRHSRANPARVAARRSPARKSAAALPQKRFRPARRRTKYLSRAGLARARAFSLRKNPPCRAGALRPAAPAPRKAAPRFAQYRKNRRAARRAALRSRFLLFRIVEDLGRKRLLNLHVHAV